MSAESKSLRAMLKELYDTKKVKGTVEKEHLLNHVIAVSNNTQSLRDLLKLLHYLDDESIEAIESIEKFAERLVPLVTKYVSPHLKDKFVEELQEIVSDTIDEIQEQEEMHRKVVVAGSKDAARANNMRDRDE